MTSFKFNHLHLVCMDLEAMITFWTKALDARLVERRRFGTAEGAVMDLNGIRVNLRLPKDGETLRNRGDETVTGFDHIGLNVDDLDTAIGRLTENGGRVVSGPTANGNRRTVFLKGPENILIELISAGHPA